MQESSSTIAASSEASVYERHAAASQNAAFDLAAMTICMDVAVSQKIGPVGLFVGVRKVPEITAPQLRKRQLRYSDLAMQAAKYGAPEPVADFVLVDVRTEAEVEVSVIPGAITAQQFEMDPERHKYKSVICYCTVGYRSELYARRLREQGIDAWNFKGSILEWCAAKYPLETLDHEPMTSLHTYSSDGHVPSKYESMW